MATPTDFEIADIVTLELINEHEFMEHIQPFIKKAVDSYVVTSNLQDEIIKFQYEAECCGAHAHTLKRLDSRIQKIVTVEILKHYWEKYSNKEFAITTHVPSTYYGIYIRKPQKPETKTMEGPKSDIQNIPVTGIEFQVLAKYTDLNNTANHKAESLFNSNRLINKAIDHFKCYKQGRWAWNTLKKAFAARVIGTTFCRNDNEEAIVNLLTLKIYQKLFKNELYQRDFTVRDIPPQCHYLFENSMFEETDIYKQVADRIKQPHDDHLDASRFITKFAKLKPEENTMNHITKIETVVRINNTDASEYSDDDIFSLIAKTEKDIEKLEAIKEKPKKLEVKIDKMKESIKELAKIVDARD